MFFDSITWAIRDASFSLELCLLVRLGPVMALLLLLLSWKMAGWKVVALTACCLDVFSGDLASWINQ